MTLSYGPMFLGWPSSNEINKDKFARRLAKLEQTSFRNLRIECSDFEAVIAKHADDFIFLDPPYYLESKSKLYGNNGDMHEKFDHKLLFDVLHTKKNWVVTYNNCEYIRNLYKDYIILDVNWSYGMNTSKESSEIIIISK